MSPLSGASRRRTTTLRLGGAVLGAALIAGASMVGAGTATAATTTPTTNISTGGPLHVLLGVGATESQRIASWYFPSNVAQSLEIEKTADMTGGVFTDAKRTIPASTSANTAADTSTTDSNTKSIPGIAAESGYANAHATISGLEPNTSYTYHVGAADGSAWSTAYTFSTKSFSGDFDFLFFGDPQIGSSGYVDDDGAGWADTLEYATSTDPAAELLVSGGDQVEHANNEYEWGAFADSSDVLKRYPWASTIGNHDVGGKAYEQHNQVPNSLKVPDFYPGGNTTTNSGGDYWYMYKGVLFIDINSNAYAGGSDATHVGYVRDVINRYGDDAKWTALVYHHSIYSPADHANDKDNQQRRFDFTRAFSDLGVDIVLQGHDHSYSRSYAIKNGKKANPDEQPAAPEVFSGPGGVIYITANSASGSKYYDLTTPDATQSGYGADPLDPTGKRHWANSVENQEHVRTFVKVSVTDDKLDVANIRASDCTTLNSAVEHGNVPSCGVTLQPTATADPAAIGSTVDRFTLDASVPATTTTVTLSTPKHAYGTSGTTATATIGGGIGTQSGVVTFFDGTKNIGEAVVKDGKAVRKLSPALVVGTHAISASFASASTTFAGTDSKSTAAATLTVVRATSTTSLTYSKGKAAVRVTAPGVTVNGTGAIYEGKKRLATFPIAKGAGSATLSLTKGKHVLRAEYLKDANVAGSKSADLTVTVK
ncbi:fibronectin type III domain-containing protein [Curtobacterium sp. A7_M15]|uniref:fibronectin type III domain-containing protein n=1 Tax=Curtobacterium sp. A7_M15 TaxID=3065241 RepID=UPI0027378712|nr:fibronectin type III domain-containing protein [Curtobacterium sp. A7_M15]MDP4334097.1 fibronectin type III domain-containing protein [Curtobacterium sp. A7_M15]